MLWHVCERDRMRVLRRLSAALQHADGHVVYEFEPACHLGAKLAGVHWWFKSRVHAAELTAGYYNTRERDGYADLMAVLRRHSARLSFTCVEMRDCEHPPEGRCSPEGERPLSTCQICKRANRPMHGGAACWQVSISVGLDAVSGVESHSAIWELTWLQLNVETACLKCVAARRLALAQVCVADVTLSNSSVCRAAAAGHRGGHGSGRPPERRERAAAVRPVRL